MATVALCRDAYNAVVALSNETSQWSVEVNVKLPEGTQPQLSPGELLAAEEIVRADETVRKLAKAVGAYYVQPNVVSRYFLFHALISYYHF